MIFPWFDITSYVVIIESVCASTESIFGFRLLLDQYQCFRSVPITNHVASSKRVKHVICVCWQQCPPLSPHSLCLQTNKQRESCKNTIVNIWNIHYATQMVYMILLVQYLIAASYILKTAFFHGVLRASVDGLTHAAEWNVKVGLGGGIAYKTETWH